MDTFAGRVHVEWNSGGLVTPLGQLPFFIEYLKQAGLFTGWVADCPLTFSSPNAPSKRDLLGTVLLSVLSGHYRYAHITTLRCDAVNPRLLGMRKVVSEDAVRRGLAKIDEAAGLTWLQRHLDYCVWPLLSEPWVLGISASHNGACCLLSGAEVRVAIQEERLVGQKRRRILLRALCIRVTGDVVAGRSSAGGSKSVNPMAKNAPAVVKAPVKIPIPV